MEPNDRTVACWEFSIDGPILPDYWEARYAYGWDAVYSGAGYSVREAFSDAIDTACSTDETIDRNFEEEAAKTLANLPYVDQTAHEALLDMGYTIDEIGSEEECNSMFFVSIYIKF